jgi:hypothetical protein
MIVKFISIVITYFWVIPKFIFFSLKKNPKQCRFERHCSPSSPTCVEVREKDILQSFFLLSLSSPLLSIKTRHNSYPHIPCHYNEANKRETCPEAAAHNHTPATLPYT